MNTAGTVALNDQPDRDSDITSVVPDVINFHLANSIIVPSVRIAKGLDDMAVLWDSFCVVCPSGHSATRSAPYRACAAWVTVNLYTLKGIISST